MKKRFFSFLLVILLSVAAQAQNPVIEYFRSSGPTDLTASVNSRQADDGKYCALIRISVPDNNLRIGGSSEGDIVFKDNIYYAYFHPDATIMTLEVPGYNRVRIDFNKYPDIFPLKSKMTYDLKIQLPVLFSDQNDDVNYRKACECDDPDQKLMHLLKIKNKTPAVLRDMAECYTYSKTIPLQLKVTKRKELDLEAARQGDARSCFFVGSDFESEKDYASSLKWHLKGGELGNPGCMYSLGDLYSGRNGTEEYLDYEKAFEWYLRAAETSNIDSEFDPTWQASAQCEVAECYLNGDGTARDYDKAFFWYKKAAANDWKYGRPMYYMGYCYENGIGTAIDLQKAYEWYKKAESCGDFDSERLVWSTLGSWHYIGIHLKQDKTKALEYFRKAADERHDAFCLNFLGEMHLVGANGLEEDYKKAYDYFFKSFTVTLSSRYHLDNSCYKSTYNLGLCYEFGWGVEQNLAEARKWYEIAMKCNIEEARKGLERLDSY